jgi:valyl-tRNA synthetase
LHYLQEVVKEAREQRANRKLDPKVEFGATLTVPEQILSPEDLAIAGKLARLKITTSANPELKNAFELQIEAPKSKSQNGALTAEARARLSKEIAALERNIENTMRQLADPIFTSKAPEKVVAGMREKLASYQAQLEKNRRLLESPEA